MEKQLNSVRNTISTQAVDLKSVHRSISAPYDRANSEALIVALQQDRTLAEELKSKSEEKLAELNEQIKSVSEAIDLIVKAGVEKIGEEAQLSLDNLKALGLAPPQVQIALLAIDTLKKLISGIGEAINYLNMLAAYNRLRQKAVDLKAQAQIQINHVTQIDGKLELLKTLDELDDGRWGFVSEFSNLVADVEKFSREFKLDESLSVEEQADSAISRISEVITYLNPIKQL
ncbi:alpha-xenorhabdolysin family binary toxin subunit B [Pseudomonas sp. 31-12]|uniref:alpha-xenorhabdolysin family binary toxin subunit B n=1 Tax=Pseudomonas sp. 31-12 TaxID=2201356 RepID=UPI003532493C